MDGTPPMNKINLQREKLKYTDSPPISPNYYQLVAGSQFMEDVDQNLQAFFKVKTKNDSAWIQPQVIYSSPYSPGEAEHKIIEFIRNRSKMPNYRIGEVSCVMTCDYDLIPLIMLTPEKNFLVFSAKRDQTGAFINFDSEDGFEFIYINILRELIEKEFSECDPRNIFQDWAVLLLFLGNDFANHLREMTPKNFPILMESYKENIAEKKLSLLNSHNEFNLESFYQLFISFYQKKSIVINTNIKYSHNDDKICEDIIHNYNWILKYYFNECPSWSYSIICKFPDIDLLLSYFKRMSSKYRCCEFILDRPFTAFERLLATYSPIRGSDMPQQIIDIALTTLKEYYPIDSEIFEQKLPYNLLITEFEKVAQLDSVKNDPAFKEDEIV